MVATTSFPQEMATWLPATLLTCSGQTIVDFVSDHQETQSACRQSREPTINRLNEGLIKTMSAKPPMAGFPAVFIE